MCNRKILGLIIVLYCVINLVNSIPLELCGGNNVFTVPRIEARQLDGWWFTQGGLVSGLISNSIFFWQFQGRIEWILDWNTTTRTCSYRQFEDKQLQSIESGPFTPCFTSRRLLPKPEEPESEAREIIFYMPTPTLLVFYRCFGEVRADEICTVRPSVRVLTRTRRILPKDHFFLKRILRRYGLSLKDLGFVNPRRNQCRIPRQRYKKQGYGK